MVLVNGHSDVSPVNNSDSDSLESCFLKSEYALHTQMIITNDGFYLSSLLKAPRVE